MGLVHQAIAGWHLDGDTSQALIYSLSGPLDSQNMTFGQGKFGQAAIFTGASTQYLRTTWNLVGSGHSRTVSLWIYPTGAGLAYFRWSNYTNPSGHK